MHNRTRIILRYLFVVVLGIFLHFAYELSGENPIVGLFSVVRESVWEHLKLIFFPMLLLTIWDLYTNHRNNLNFLPARTIGILSGMAFIIIVYYTVTGIIGANITWVTILIYLLSVVYAFWIERTVCVKCRNLSISWAILILIVSTILFIIFTLVPPPLGIFEPLA